MDKKVNNFKEIFNHDEYKMKLLKLSEKYLNTIVKHINFLIKEVAGIL